jgi:hypothetical protein
MRFAVLILAAALMSGAAVAAPPAVAPGPPPPPATVSPLTVFPRTEAPKLVKSFPAAGQAIAPGILVLSVTFDQPMLKTGFDVGAGPGGEAPQCLKTPRLLNDTKTFVLLCATVPHKSYVMAFNARPQGGFENVAEHRADPATLAFSTTDGEGPRDIHAAMKAAGLTDLDMPIQDTPEHRTETPKP